MKVSVIIPVYNAAAHLEECLKSVCAQTLNDIEIICVNDGSTDTSATILEAAAKADSRIRVLTQANAGAAAARNNALEHIQGDFVAFMDADDLYPSQDTLSTLYTAATAAKVPMSGGGIDLLLPDGMLRGVETPDEAWRAVPKTQAVVDFAEVPYDQGFTKYLYSAALFKEGLRFPVLSQYEDPPFLVAAMVKARRYASVDRVVYRYRLAERVNGRRVRLSDAKIRDFIRGLTMVLSTSARGDLVALHRAVWARVVDFEFRDYLCDLPTNDAETFRLLTRLSGAGDAQILDEDAPMLPYLDDIRRQARFGRRMKRILGGWLKDLVFRVVRRAK